MKATRTHLVIPDLQVTPNTANDHLRWIGMFMLEKKPDVIINIGDMADMASLSSYDKGKKSFEGRRVKEDFDCVKEANEILFERLINDKHWNHCETHLTLGNHEDRILRAIENSAEFEGLFGIEDLEYEDFYDHVHDFLQPVYIDGVAYCHYFYPPGSSKAYNGESIITRIKNIGFSFTQGHQQGLMHGNRHLINGQTIHGTVCGSCYLYDHGYIGPQHKKHWKGIICKHEVSNGSYDIMPVSLNYLCRTYEGMDIPDFLMKKYGRKDGWIS
jgi:hypothetical protein